MKSRSMFLLSGATAMLIMVAAMVMLQFTPAEARKDQCYDAVINLYSECDLVLELTGYELDSAKEAEEFCRDEEDSSERACWTGCALDNPDCGRMADCIDDCFDGETRCGFTMQFIFNTCDINLKDPDTDEVMTQETATANCKDATGDLGDMYDCFTNCGYSDYDECTDMLSCINDCYSGDNVDDDFVDDDEDGTGETDEGEELEDVGGSPCGI